VEKLEGFGREVKRREMEGGIERDGGQCSAATADVFSKTRTLVATAAAPL
jgi:hypothetical protein